MSSYSIENVRELEQALASGARRVRFSTGGGATREVEYQSRADMLAQLNSMRRELGLIRNQGFAVNYPKTGKGIE